jgi:thiamine pyrophosphate-dependent acetolactate synthase large subunit-like protein
LQPDPSSATFGNHITNFIRILIAEDQSRQVSVPAPANQRICRNAQKTLENAISKLKPEENCDWVEKHRKLYDDYFQELWQVKAVLADYSRVKDIIGRQAAMVGEYRAAWALFQQDTNFTAQELGYIISTPGGLRKALIKSFALKRLRHAIS